MKKLVFLLIAALCLSLLPAGALAGEEAVATGEMAAAEEDVDRTGQTFWKGIDEPAAGDPADSDADASTVDDEEEEAHAFEESDEPADVPEAPEDAASAEAGSPAQDGASSGTCGKNGDNLTWTLSGDGVLTISGTGEMRDYNMGGMSTGFLTTAPWGYACKKLVIEYGVTSIGKYAFCQCQQLEAIAVATSVTSIGDNAFLGCIGLTRITFANGLRDIGKYAFCGCYNLTDVTLGHNVSTIGARAFSAESSSSTPLNMTLRFTGNAPEIYKDAFFKSTITASYPKDDPTWTAEKRQDFGGTVDWQPAVLFLIGRDNNAFAHSPVSMGVDEPIQNAMGNAYPIYWEHYQILLQNISEKHAKKLGEMVFSENWGGFCEGLTLSMILANNGSIDVSEICLNDALDSYHSIDDLKKYPTLRERINYYQLLQTAGKLKPDDLFVRSLGKWLNLSLSSDHYSISSWGDFWNGFFDAIRDGQKKKTPILLSFDWKESENDVMHSVVVCGINDSHPDYTIVELYDCNTNELCVKGHVDELEQYIYLIVYKEKEKVFLSNTDDPSGRIDPYFNDSTWEYFGYYSADTIKSIDAGTTVTVPDLSAAVFEAAGGAAFTIKNVEGKTFSYDGTEYSGDMELLDLEYLAFGDQSTVRYTVPVSGSFTLTGAEDGAEYGFMLEESYYTAQTAGADEITFSDGRGVEVKGTDYSFAIGVSVNDTLGLMRVSGNAVGDGKFLQSNGSGDAIDMTARGSFTDVSVRTITESGVTENALSGSYSQITVDDNGVPRPGHSAPPSDDADGNGTVNRLDAACILRITVGLQSGDARLTPADAAGILAGLK